MPHYDIGDVTQGSDYSLLFQAKDNNGIPLDLSNYNIGSCIKSKYSSCTGLLSFSSSLPVPQSGICQASLTYNQTSGLAPNTYIYNIWVYNMDHSSVFNLLEGYMNINPTTLC